MPEVCPAKDLFEEMLARLAIKFAWLVNRFLQFELEPQAHYQRVAQSFLNDKSQGEIARMIKEIEQELRKPTQQVRDILSLPQDEDDLRRFLRLVVDYWVMLR